MRRLALLAALLGAALALAPATAAARTTRVTTDAELTAALASALPGDTIQLAPGAYAPVTISGRGSPAADLTIAGEGGATVSGMTITGSQRIVVSGLGVVNLFAGFADLAVFFTPRDHRDHAEVSLHDDTR